MNVRLCSAVCFSLLSACATPPSPPAGPVPFLTVQGYGGRNDLLPDRTGTIFGRYSAPVSIGTSTIYLPLDPVVQCDAAHTQCQHGIIKMVVVYTVRAADGGGVKLAGEARFHLAGEHNLDNNLGHLHQAVPTGVPRLPEQRETRAFDSILHLGEKLSIPGPAGSSVVVRIEPGEQATAQP